MTRRARVIGALVVAALALAAVAAYIVHLERALNRMPPAELVPTSWEQFKTSEGHRVHVDEHDVACGDCHDFARHGLRNPSLARCAHCHAKESAQTHSGDAAMPTNCLTCHAFAPKPAPGCMACHAQAHGESAAIVVHARTKCTDCHEPHHDPPVVPEDCAKCHTEVTPRHAEHAGSRGCLDCHTGHAPGAEAKTTCSTCHTTPAGPRPAGHDSCLGCHGPHRFVAGGQSACVLCHGEKPTLAAASVSAHDDCLACHTPHAPTLAAGACVRCHAAVRTSHPAVGDASVCTTCHAPHAATARLASTCTSCHSKVASTDTAAHAGGVACKECHAPHDFARPSDQRTFCATCHWRQDQLVGVNAGHADCARCHGTNAHAPASAPACGSCHAMQQSTAPTGHQGCTRCHDAHSGARGPQASCGGCHADEAHDRHSRVIGSCTPCHRAHGPGGVARPPGCADCHARASLAGLHAVSGHSTCASCHVPHLPPRADRATCTSCHAAQKNHQPQATACNGCHVFR